MRDPLRAMAASTLVCEALVVFFAGLVAMRLSNLSMGQAFGLTGAVAVACLLAAGMLRSPLGYGLGSVLQVIVIGLGLWVPDMFGIGLLFAALWVGSLWYGSSRRAWLSARRSQGRMAQMVAPGVDRLSSTEWLTRPR